MDARLLNTLHFHLERLPEAAPEEQERHWTKLEGALDEVLAGPAGAGAAQLRKQLVQARADVAERRLPANYVSLLHDLKAVARRSKRAARAPERSLLEQAAELVRGRALLLVGGEPREEHRERLQQALQLSNVFWPETSEQNPRLDVLEPYIARPDVAAVLLLIRWVRHTVNNEIGGLCERHGKPLVRVPGGYNENQIAQLLLDQTRHRLGGAPG